MIIELYRPWTPEDMTEDFCGVCGHTIAPASVVASARTDGRGEMDAACPKCIEYLGSRNPEKSPTIEEYRKLLRTYPAPMYASEEELERAAEAAGYEDPADFAHEASCVWRAPRQSVTA